MKKAKFISVSSGKGGVGKSFVCINMGISMVRAGFKALVIDADIGFANIDVMLGIHSDNSISDVADGDKSIDELTVKHSSGLDVLCGGSGLSSSFILTDKNKDFLLKEMKTITGNYDYVIIDNSAGISKEITFFSSHSGTNVIILSPDPTSLTDSYSLIKILSLDFDIIDYTIIVNQANEETGNAIFNRISKVADKYIPIGNLTYGGAIPKDPDIVECIRSQRTIFEEDIDVANSIENTLKKAISKSSNAGFKPFWQKALSEGLK